jgi:hypothetical protein
MSDLVLRERSGSASLQENFQAQPTVMLIRRELATGLASDKSPLALITLDLSSMIQSVQ